MYNRSTYFPSAWRIEEVAPFPREVLLDDPSSRIPARSPRLQSKTRHAEEIFQKLLLINDPVECNDIVAHLRERKTVYPRLMYRDQLHGCGM